MKQFIDLPNVEPIWKRINDLYVRKNSNYVEHQSIYKIKQQSAAEIPTPVDLNDINKSSEAINITQLGYQEFEQFVNSAAAEKYVEDDHRKYSAISVYKEYTKPTEQIATENTQTNSVLIRTDIGIFEMYAVHEVGAGDGGIKEYQLHRKPYIMRLMESEINSVCDKVLTVDKL